VKDNGDVVYREWASSAVEAYLIGDFSKMDLFGRLRPMLTALDNWDRNATPMKKNEFGVFEVTVPGKDGKPAIPHDSKLKVNAPRS
jgi:1,4-alpha-glucan branching enzyme